MSRFAYAIGLAALFASPAGAAPELKAEMVRSYPAAEANQGVAVDARAFYAVDNSAIGRYDKATGQRTGGWTGDPKAFPHLNSCAVVEAELVCASSNYPATPMASTVEVFDLAGLTHKRSIPLGRQVGSLTWAVRQGGFWWAGFANYDGKGGEPGRDHSFTALVKFDDDWKPLGRWRFPAAVLDRFAPMSNSGGVWGADGLLYISGHDEPVVFVLRLPARGDTLELAATISAPIEGQAIARDPSDATTLYGIARTTRQVVAMKLPKLDGAK